MKQMIENRAKQLLCFVVCLLLLGMKTYASEGEDVEYVIISVDAIDESGKVMYALDTDAPSAFTEIGEFSVPAGTSHTIYVKDEAGNITSQIYKVGGAENEVGDITADNAELPQQINIDLEIGPSGKQKKDSYEYLTDTPVENGQGTVSKKITTDGSGIETKVFYTITTAEGEVFYMVIDQSQSTGNVYLLTQVTKADLKALAVSEIEEKEEESESLLQTLNFNNTVEETESKDAKRKNSNSTGDWIIYILIFSVIGGGYYYLKIYKPKKAEEVDLEDAMDMDEFKIEEENEEELEENEYTLSELQEGKKKILEEIMKEDE